MSDKVTSLFGGTVSAIDQPVPEIVAFLERLLARAKSGEMRAVAVAYVRGNGRPSAGWQSDDDPQHNFALHSGIACLLGEYTDLLNTPDNCTVVELPPDPAPDSA